LLYQLILTATSYFLWAFIGSFAKFRKTTINFFMSVCPSVPPHGATLLQLDRFSLNLIRQCFLKNLLSKFKYR
jgi:hypothetical protein